MSNFPMSNSPSPTGGVHLSGLLPPLLSSPLLSPRARSSILSLSPSSPSSPLFSLFSPLLPLPAVAHDGAAHSRGGARRDGAALDGELAAHDGARAQGTERRRGHSPEFAGDGRRDEDDAAAERKFTGDLGSLTASSRFLARAVPENG